MSHEGNWRVFMTNRPSTVLKRLQYMIRGVLVSLAAISLLILADPMNAFLSSGIRGIKGYFEHLALQGIDLTSKRPSDIALLVQRGKNQFLLLSAGLFVSCAGLLLADFLIARKRASLNGAMSPSGNGGGLPEDQSSRDPRHEQ